MDFYVYWVLAMLKLMDLGLFSSTAASIGISRISASGLKEFWCIIISIWCHITLT
jgi:hypothetical protein